MTEARLTPELVGLNTFVEFSFFWFADGGAAGFRVHGDDRSLVRAKRGDCDRRELVRHGTAR